MLVLSALNEYSSRAMLKKNPVPSLSATWPDARPPVAALGAAEACEDAVADLRMRSDGPSMVTAPRRSANDSLNAGRAPGAVTVGLVALSAHAASRVHRAMTLERDTFDMIVIPLYVVD